MSQRPHTATLEVRRLPEHPAPVAHDPARILSSSTLFKGEREIGIEHAGALYRLKITRQGKLILNK